MNTTFIASPTIVDLGRRINALGEQHDAIEVQQMALAELAPEYVSTEASLTQLSAEEQALAGLILTMQPGSLSDAAVQLGVLFDNIVAVAGSELLPQLNSGSLERELHIFERAIGRLAAVVCKATGIDPATISQPDLERRLARYYPDRSARTTAVDYVRREASQKAMSDAYFLLERPTGISIPELAAAWRSMEAPTDLDDEEMEQWIDTKGRLLSMLAAASPTNTGDLILKAEAAVRRLLHSLENGDRETAVELGQATLHDLQAAVTVSARSKLKRKNRASMLRLFRWPPGQRQHRQRLNPSATH